MTHTFAILEVSPSAFAEVRGNLVNAGYQHALLRDDGRELVDMHGIAIGERPRARSEAERFGDDPAPLPCPFCGRTDLLGVERHPESGFTVVRCRACGCVGPAGRGIEGEPTARAEAIANWNRRGGGK